MDKTLLWQRLWQVSRAVWVLLITVSILLILYYVTPLVYPFIIGWVVAYMLNPLVNMLQHRFRFPRWLAVTASLALFLSISIVTVTLMVTNIIIEIGSLVNSIQDVLNHWKNQLTSFTNSEQLKFLLEKFNTIYQNENYQETIKTQLSNTTSSLTNLGSIVVSYVFNSIIKLLSALPNIVTLAIISLLGAFFISKNWIKLLKKISVSYPEKMKKNTRSVWIDLQKALFGYLRAQIIILSITAILITLGLTVLHVKYALSIGLFIGLFDLLPYVGTGFIMLPWIVYEFIQNNFYLGIGISVVYIIVIVARQLIEPKVLASNVGLDPLATLIAMFVGLKLFGVLGLIIGPVTLVILSAFHRARIFTDLWFYIVYGKKPVE